MSDFKKYNLEEWKMATVGQSLPAPESGWQRYDNTDSRIFYNGIWITAGNDATSFYSGNVTLTTRIGDFLIIKFYGTKIRIIMQPHTSRSDTLKIAIDDDIEYYSNASSNPISQCLVYEKLNLALGVHTVIITNQATNNGSFDFDAFDIDSDGYLVNPTSINLVASAGNARVTLTWDVISSATGYNVKRSTTVGGPYTTIASNVATNSYVDTDVVNDTTYYYVVSAITADGESANSNEASATPTAPPVEEGEAVLRVTMTDSSEREYKVSKVIANDFVAWCNRTIGTGNSCYAFDKSIQDSKEYLFYEKIISFEVIPLA